MVATLADVAQQAGVSTATASLVLSGKSEGRVSSRTVDLVKRIAEETGYVRNSIAGSLRTKCSNMIGIISDEIGSTPYAVQMFATANRVAHEKGYVVILADTYGTAETEAAAVDTLRAQRVDHIAYACMYHRKVELPKGLDSKTVILDGYTDDPEIASVVPDDFQGAVDATTHLIGLGHTRIGFINNKNITPASELRLAGYCHALKNANLRIDPTLMAIGSPHAEDANAAALELLDRPNRPTAIFAFNDGIAAGVYRQAYRLNLRIPEDISIIGFDNLELITCNLDPHLTTMQLPHKEMAEWSILRLLGYENTDETWPLKMPCPLIEGYSTAPPNM